MSIEFAQFGEIAESLGLLGVVVVGIWAFYTGRIFTRGREDQIVRDLTAKFDYAERLRAEEREARIHAEERLLKMTDAIESLTVVLQGVKEELVRRR